jgi:L-ascorbate metabolism protein UlaG (beta-lactamase superfamily)
VKRRGTLACGGAAFLSACLIAVGPGVEGEVDRTGGAPDEVRLVYLGSGGWIMQRGDDMVLSGPLFTNPGLIPTGVLGIRSDTSAVNHYMAHYDSLFDVSRTSAIVVGHAHYDHLMDVPQVARRFATSAEIVASRTSANILGTWSGVGDRVRVVNDIAGDQETVATWISVAPRVRNMALRSHHAPHFDGYTLYRGTRDTPMSAEPEWATDWVEGQSFSYLIDFLDASGSVAFRIYYQDAVSPAPSGFAPDATIAEHPVDVAILVPSTFDQVDWHPEAFVENLRPRWVLLGHWEDFFRPMDAETKSIRLTDMGHFEGRLDRVFDGEFWRPEKGTEFRFAVR